MSLLKCIIVQFFDWWKVKIEEIQENSTYIFWNKMEKMTFSNINVLCLQQILWII